MISKNKAFSLIELSIVVLIIGILISGVTQGSRLIKASKLQTAKTLTLSSDVNSIKDLAMWLETSLDNSVTIDSSSTVTRWNDINPQSMSKINAYNTTPDNPVYVENVINGLPVIKFYVGPEIPADQNFGENIEVDPNGLGLSFLANTNYTIFVVEQRVSSGSLDGKKSMFLSGHGMISPSINLQIGYSSNKNFIWDNTGTGSGATKDASDWNIPVTLSAAITPRIHTFKFDTTKGKYYSMKSNISAPYSATNTGAIGKPLVSYYGATIGGKGPGSDDLSIAEMIIFTRALSTDEIKSVEAYLGKKYAIKIS